MTNLENNIAKNLIDNMTAEQKAEFLNLNEADRAEYAVAFAMDIIKKHTAMATELLLSTSKMEQFSSVVAAVA